MEALAIRNGKETRLSDGRRVSVQLLEEVKVDKKLGPKNTSYHEACHALAALLTGAGLDYLTNVPEGNSLGHTKLGRYDALAAAAAHAMGCDGTSHDLSMIAMQRESVHGAVAGAKNLLAPHKKELLAIATALEARSTMSGGQTMAIVRAVDKETREGKLALVTITNPDGTKEKVEKRWPNNVVMIPEFALPRETPKLANENALPKAA